MSSSNSFELNDFFDAQAQDGEYSGTGNFTLSLEQARLKLSRFQFSHSAVWALKIVQAAVSSGCVQAVSVKQTRRKQVFAFDSGPAWTAAQIREAVLSAEGRFGASLEHFASALRQLTFNLGRRVEVCCEGWNQALVCSQDALEIVSQTTSARGLRITIFPADSTSALGWWKAYSTISADNADVGRLLAGRALSCPIPLTLDNRRLDTLFCPQQEVLSLVGRLEDGVEIDYQVRLRQAGSFFTRRRPARAPALAWTRDGVVLEKEELPLGRHSDSVTVFLKSDGLKTDISGMKLQPSPDRRQRRLEALRKMAPVLAVEVPDEFAGRSLGHKQLEGIRNLAMMWCTMVMDDWLERESPDLAFLNRLGPWSSTLEGRNLRLHLFLKSRPECPFCGADFSELKYYRGVEKKRLSCVICQSCARSSRIEEFETASAGRR